MSSRDHEEAGEIRSPGAAVGVRAGQATAATGVAPNEYRRRRRCTFPLILATTTNETTKRNGDDDDDVFANDERRRKAAETAALLTASANHTDAEAGKLTASNDFVRKIRRLLSSHADDIDEEDEDDDDDDDDDDHENNNIDSLTLNAHHVFTQMDMLCEFESGDVAWKEIARWIKYEEKVDPGDHWSKPHVSTLPLHALMQLRNAIADNSCILRLNVPAVSGIEASLREIAETLVSEIRGKAGLSDDEAQTLMTVLLRPHKHKHRKVKRKYHKSKHPDNQKLGSGDDVEDGTSRPSSTAVTPITSTSPNPERKKMSRIRFWFHKRPGKHQVDAMRSFPGGGGPESMDVYKSNKRIQKKLPKGTEAASILIGQLAFVKQPIMALFRLSEPALLGDMCEIATHTRFIFLVLCPNDGESVWECTEIGRAMAVLLGDTVFCEVAYLAQSRDQLLAGVDEFIDDLTVLPPSIWDPSTRMEPPQQTISPEKLYERLQSPNRWAKAPDDNMHGHEEAADQAEGLNRTGRVFGGLIGDIKRRYRHYKSDFTDGIHSQCIASTVFLFFACITPIVTFGGLMGQKTGGNMGTMETLLSGAVCGVGFGLFAGQPLTIVGATGPLLVFESILYTLCKSFEVDFMSLRCWVGFWVAACLLIVVAFDLSFLVQYITRFTEESFAVLISVIFIFEAFDKIADLWTSHRVNVGVGRQGPPLCFCVRPSHDSMTPNGTAMDFGADNGTGLFVAAESYDWDAEHGHYHDADYKIAFNESSFDWLPSECWTTHNRTLVGVGCMSIDGCRAARWQLDGSGCDVVSDVFLLSIVLFFGTFALAMFCRSFRSTGYLPTIVRSTLGDFAVPLSVFVWSAVDFAFRIDTPKLNVPRDFKPTSDERGWVINPLAVTYWWLAILAALPAFLATILVFLDQQITAVIVNRSENKLKKGFGYHLDLFVLSALIVVCSIIGLPWFVAATVRSITHVQSLVRYSDVQAPGERPKMLGVREQRLTGVLIHLLIGFSTLLTTVLRFIPMPVLYGVFLYMGITSLGGVQFIQRILILIMPPKYQPDYVYLRHVRTLRVHLFTAIQLVCSGLMWAIKSVKAASIAFPLMLVALIAVRKVLDYFYTQQELYWLDHLLPEDDRRKAEDEQRKSLETSLVELSSGDTHRRKSVVLLNANGVHTEVEISVPDTKRHSR